MAAQRSGGVQLRGWGLIAKQAIKAALRYGKKYLPARIRPYPDRLYDLIDRIDGLKEAAIANSPFALRLPPDVAICAARRIVTLL